MSQHPILDTFISLTLGEQAARFLTILPFLKRIDNRLDKFSPEEWKRYGDALLGDEPSLFLQALLDGKDRATIEAQVERFRGAHTKEQFSKDVWQVYNLLALQLQNIAQISEQMTTAPDNLELRRQLAKEHEHLSVLATMSAAFSADVLGADIRRLSHQHGNDLTKIYPELVKDRHLTLGGKQIAVAEFGAAQQAIDDANDFVSDLRSEVEHKRISPNQFILKLMDHGASPEELLGQLKAKRPRMFEGKDGYVRGNALGPFQKMIRQELLRHKPGIDLVAAQCAPMGLSVDGTFFPTFNDDHLPHEGRGSTPSSMHWTQRAVEFVKALCGQALTR